MECFILAGGKSRRFGEDKLLFEIKGKKVIELVVEALKPVCKRLCLLTKDKEKFSFLSGVEVYKDIIQKQYALAGLYTALHKLKGEKAFIVAGDMPLIKPEVALYLWESSKPPITVYNIKGKVYPLFGVYYRRVLEPLEEYIKSGGERLVDFIKRVGYKEIGEEEIKKLDPELLSFINMNTKEELAFIIKSYEGNYRKN